MLDTGFGVPTYIAPGEQKQGPAINVNCAFPVRIILCPRCHLVELYHDVNLPPPC
jgi:hypothetical protein